MKKILFMLIGIGLIGINNVNAENFPTWDFAKPQPEFLTNQTGTSTYTFGDGGDISSRGMSNTRVFNYVDSGGPNPLNSDPNCKIILNGSTIVGYTDEAYIQPGDTYKVVYNTFGVTPLVVGENKTCTMGLRYTMFGGDFENAGPETYFTFMVGFDPNPVVVTPTSTTFINQTYLTEFNNEQRNSTKNGINNGLGITNSVMGQLILLSFLIIGIIIFVGIIFYIIRNKKNTN